MQFDASRRAKKMLHSSRDKNEGTYRIVGREEEGSLRHPGFELLLLGRSARVARG